jgi:tRNA A37 threonylcarbamoyladenosine modification protein TsaB
MTLEHVTQTETCILAIRKALRGHNKTKHKTYYQKKNAAERNRIISEVCQEYGLNVNTITAILNGRLTDVQNEKLKK